MIAEQYLRQLTLINSCGHKLVTVDKCSKAVRQKVIDGIVANVKAGNSQ